MIRSLAVLMLSAAPAIAAICPEAGAGGTEISLSSRQLAAPHGVQVIAGGPVELAACGAVAGTGRVARMPDVTLHIAADAAPAALTLRTRARCDTVLLVGHASGWAFDDDGGGGENALLRLEAAGGRIDVWVGSFGGGSCKARLYLSAAD
ncbi:hypothetical protein BH23PSE1_BH23PSE1_05740 [soil metagenome]